MMKILLVDDDVELGTMLSQYLIGEGFETQLALTGAAGITGAMSGQYDAMILDIMLPDADGRELLQQLRTNEKTADIPVLMISAKYTDKTIQHGPFKPNGFLAKPFDIDELLDKIEGILAGKTY